MISIPGYKNYEEIGKGGMATVYRAIQESTDRQVAIKVMSPSLSADISFTERFLKEARMAYLSHPNIITVHDSGEIDGNYYIVMEYATGGNFDKKIKAGLTPVEVLRIVLQIASALEYAAKNNVVHRDVKPDNILLKDDNRALLVDFGIAKATTSGDKLTTMGMTVGSTHYMSPEQARGLEIDTRSDLYSLGVVIYEALTSKMPYQGDDTFAVAIMHINDPIPQLPDELIKFQPIVEQLLAKDPDDRYQNATELIYALENLYDELNIVDSSDVNRKPTAASLEAEKEKKIKVERMINPSAKTVLNRSIDDFDYRTVINPAPKALRSTKKSSQQLTVLFIAVVVFGAGAAYYFPSSSDDDEPLNRVVLSKPAIPKIIKLNEITEPVPEVPIVIEASPEQIVDNNATLIEALLTEAEIHLNKNRLTSPKSKNAYERYLQVLELESGNIEAVQGIEAIAEKYYQLSMKQERKGNVNKALQYANKGIALDAGNKKFQRWREELLALNRLPKLKKGYFEKNISAFRGSVTHKATNRKQAIKYARLSLTNRIYADLSKDCNKNIKRLASVECTELLKRSYGQWPIPVIFSKFQIEIKDAYTYGSYTANGSSDIRQLKNKMQSLFMDIKDTAASGEQKKIAYANLLHYQPLASLAGLEIVDIPTDIIEKKLAEESHLQKPINSILKLRDLIEGDFNTSNMVLHSVTSDSSLEITPYAAEIIRSFSDVFPSIEDKKTRLYGKYKIQDSGLVEMDFWQFDPKNEIIGIKRYKLSEALYKQFRRDNFITTADLLPDSLNNTGDYFASEIALSNKSAYRQLTIGEKIKLQIKMEQAGYYYIVMHIVREDDVFSYLLPLKRDKVPFVKRINEDQLNRFVNLGELKIDPPAGVEVMQLISSNINLENYLPETTWSGKRKKHLLKNNDGKLSKGLNIVRSAANKVSMLNADKNPRWQERLLVTSIVHDTLTKQ